MDILFEVQKWNVSQEMLPVPELRSDKKSQKLIWMLENETDVFCPQNEHLLISQHREWCTVS